MKYKLTPVFAVSSVFFLAAAVGCGPSSGGGAETLGATELNSANASALLGSPLSSRLNAFGSLVVNSPGGKLVCTASHLGGGYVLTSGHCIAEMPNFRNTVGSLMRTEQSNKNAVSCSSISIKWGINGAGGTSACESVVSLRTGLFWDYAVLKVKLPPGSTLPKVIDSIAPKWPANDLNVFVVGFAQEGKPTVVNGCKVERASRTLGLLLRRWTHNCAVERGFSGAIIFDASTRTPIGVHQGPTSFVKNGSEAIRSFYPLNRRPETRSIAALTAPETVSEIYDATVNQNNLDDCREKFLAVASQRLGVAGGKGDMEHDYAAKINALSRAHLADLYSAFKKQQPQCNRYVREGRKAFDPFGDDGGCQGSSQQGQCSDDKNQSGGGGSGNDGGG